LFVVTTSGASGVGPDSAAAPKTSVGADSGAHTAADSAADSSAESPHSILGNVENIIQAVGARRLFICIVVVCIIVVQIGRLAVVACPRDARAVKCRQAVLPTVELVDSWLARARLVSVSVRAVARILFFVLRAAASAHHGAIRLLIRHSW